VTPTKRYHCAARVSPQCRPNSKRTKCAYCGSRVYAEEGFWTVQVWNGENRYSLAGAVGGRTYRTEAAARKAEEALNAGGNTYIARFVS